MSSSVGTPPSQTGARKRGFPWVKVSILAFWVSVVTTVLIFRDPIEDFLAEAADDMGSIGLQIQIPLTVGLLAIIILVYLSFLPIPIRPLFVIIFTSAQYVSPVYTICMFVVVQTVAGISNFLAVKWTATKITEEVKSMLKQAKRFRIARFSLRFLNHLNREGVQNIILFRRSEPVQSVTHQSPSSNSSLSYAEERPVSRRRWGGDSHQRTQRSRTHVNVTVELQHVRANSHEQHLSDRRCRSAAESQVIGNASSRLGRSAFVEMGDDDGSVHAMEEGVGVDAVRGNDEETEGEKEKERERGRTRAAWERTPLGKCLLSFGTFVFVVFATLLGYHVDEIILAQFSWRWAEIVYFIGAQFCDLKDLFLFWAVYSGSIRERGYVGTLLETWAVVQPLQAAAGALLLSVFLVPQIVFVWRDPTLGLEAEELEERQREEAEREKEIAGEEGQSQPGGLSPSRSRDMALAGQAQAERGSETPPEVHRPKPSFAHPPGHPLHDPSGGADVSGGDEWSLSASAAAAIEEGGVPVLPSEPGAPVPRVAESLWKEGKFSRPGDLKGVEKESQCAPESLRSVSSAHWRSVGGGVSSGGWGESGGGLDSAVAVKAGRSSIGGWGTSSKRHPKFLV
uniref:Uncharacterized protein n=1 Tax=Chromera velia CCMP2878 TaxID=1169474 RepID=A0A0G4I4F0_9ALVE|eukprot:Cvel_1791.t1-p1 / transcript=Cvel_1791.t1 / gene=Cvel_1791 / organism=Chromera_velia_CCMP2878 / gene_product=hypothetical protein / transcript_product=hypothetical protein / location=Cvel_scaffold66:19579-23088(+) / protein_length=623 / sequence_SO=supercontig / SO=protein_coding / is_pseudo=false